MHRFRSAILPKELVPTFGPKGRRIPPKIRPRQANELRKAAILAGKYKEGAQLSAGEWDPNWDRVNFKKATVLREPRGSIIARRRDEKVRQIEAAMVGMEERIKEHHEQRVMGKPVSFYERQLAKVGYDVMGDKKEKSKSAKKKDAKRKKKNQE